MTVTPLLKATTYTAPRLGQCSTPACKATAGEGLFRNFCDPCAGNLARIRDEYLAETARICPSTQNGLVKRQVRQATCCSPYCTNPRTPPAAFCEDCTAAGFTEEDEAA